MPAITEGNVSKRILSFSHGDFLFAGTVCKSWHDNASCLSTNGSEALGSLSRVKEMYECGLLGGTLPRLRCAHSLFRAVQVSRNIEVLRFLESKSVPFLGDGDSDACEHLHDEHMKFLLESKLGAPRQHDLIMAIRNKLIDVAELLIEYGCPMPEEIIDYAMMSRELDFAKRLVDRGCMVQRSAYESMFEDIWWNEEAMEFDFRPCLAWIHSLRRPFDFKGLEEMMEESVIWGWQDVFEERPDVKDWFDEMIADYHMTRAYNQCAKRRR